MDFGEFTLVLEDENGRREVALNATIRAPMAGEWVDVGGRWYQVRLVTHPQLERNTLRKHLGLVMFAVPVETGKDVPGPEGSDQDPSASSSENGSRARASLKVLPFERPSSSASAIFPAPLLLTLVACAYQEQSILFEAAKFEAWKLIHNGSRWFLERMASASSDTYRRLSREALFQFREAESYILERWPLEAVGSEPSSNILDLARYRMRKSGVDGSGW